MAQAAYEHATTKFTKEMIVPLYESVYEKAMNG
jgi:hypothetical protein